jgi:hypothetical protein
MFRSLKEFTLGQLVEEPVVGLAMQDAGIDRRSIELMLGLAGHSRDSRGSLPHAPFVS